MSKKLKIIAWTLLAVVVGAAAYIFSMREMIFLPDYGTTINLHGGVSNIESQIAFVNAYEQGKSGQWKRVVYTIEGDPVIYTVRFVREPFSLKLSIDTRQDQFSGSRRVETFSCKEMLASDRIRLTGCEGAPNGEIDIP